jgi:large subunit ribosomal protein L9
MRVILTEVINKLGKIGEVVTVNNGYAKNFLIPKKKAICFTDANFRVFESKRAEYEKLNFKNLDLANKVKIKIEGKNIIIIQNASDDGRLYGSVNSGVIANSINEIIGEKSVSRGEIFLKKPIKEIGLYEFKLIMHSEAELNLKLAVARSESEADNILHPEKKIAKEAEEKRDENNENETRKKNTRKPFRKKKEEEEVSE